MYQKTEELYAANQGREASGRELEASVLTKAGFLLKAAQDNWQGPGHDERLLEALQYNQKVWSFFQAELSDPDNPLPTKLRQDILSLSMFVDKRLREVMEQPLSERLNIIIEIDFNIAEGLRSQLSR